MEQTRVVYRSYQERIKPTHPLYKTFLKLTKASKNLYNLALYHQRQTFFQEGRFLDRLNLRNLLKENADKSRRVYRGLFQSNGGYLINADVNAAYQILKKVGKGNIVFDPTYKINLQPIKVNVA